MDTSAFLDYLEREKQDILANCTRCGKCVEVCPMTQYSEVQTLLPETVIREVAGLLETGVPTPAARAWASSCSNSGHCIPACPEGVNPRKMLALARLELKRHEAMGEVAPLRQAGRTKFKGLHDAIRLLQHPEDPGYCPECTGCARPPGGGLRSGWRHGQLLRHQFYASWRRRNIVCPGIADAEKHACL